MNLTNKNSNKAVRQTFSFYTRFTASASIARVDLNPVITGASTFFGPALVNFANLYEQFRFVEIKVQIQPHQDFDGTAAQSTAMVMGYAPMKAASAPTTAEDISALTECVVQSTGVTVPAVFSLRRRCLMPPTVVKWYNVDTSPDPVTGIQGSIYYTYAGTNSGTLTATWLVQATIECRSPVNFGEFLSRQDIIAKRQPADGDLKVDLSPAPQTVYDVSPHYSKVTLPDGTVIEAHVCGPFEDHKECQSEDGDGYVVPGSTQGKPVPKCLPPAKMARK